MKTIEVTPETLGNLMGRDPNSLVRSWELGDLRGRGFVYWAWTFAIRGFDRDRHLFLLVKDR